MKAQSQSVVKPGDKFGKLTADREISGRYKNSKWYFCTCECGGSIILSRNDLVNTKIVSCGCASKKTRRDEYHGMTNSSEYASWQSMKDRCTNPNSKHYKNYGARGIKVCDEWIDSFDQFYADMGKRPSRKHSLERIDNERGYEPSNCKWEIRAVQNRNKRTNRLIKWRGKEQCLLDWAKELDISIKTLSNRIVRSGWDVERAFTEPVQRKNPGSYKPDPRRV